MKNMATREFNVVKYFHKFTMTGGEPFLHSNLNEFIEFLYQYKSQYEVLEIITNGTLLPSEKLLNTLKKYNDVIFVLIDDYGSLSPKAADCAELFKKNSIECKLRCYYGDSAYCGGWLDQGDFNTKWKKEEIPFILDNCVTQQFKNNSAVSKKSWNENSASDDFFIKYICSVDGLIARCARAYSTFMEGRTSNIPVNFVNLYDVDRTDLQLRVDLMNMFSSTTYEACAFCNGYSSTGRRYEPAEQIISGTANGERQK
jgi:hypothetical protein